jgi:hypothetical protein
MQGLRVHNLHAQHRVVDALWHFTKIGDNKNARPIVPFKRQDMVAARIAHAHFAAGKNAVRAAEGN